MKVEIGEQEIIIYLPKESMLNFQLEDMDAIEDSFRTLFSKLEEYYHIHLEGFYNIDVFLDLQEGMVLRLEKEDLDYYSFHQVEMRIVKEEVSFLYQVEDILDFLEDSYDIYFYQDHWYVKKRGTEDDLLLYEWGKLIYENTDCILKNGILLTH